MKKNKHYINKNLTLTVFSLLLIIIFTGCANYNASALKNLSTEIITTSSSHNDTVQMVSKTYTAYDCKKYLDRNVIFKGYQPIQIYIQNSSDETYLFSTNRISLPCASAKEVAEKVHTSTIGRVTAYGVGSLFIWPLAIPAIVDGIKSQNANKSLDNDFANKTAIEQVIFPRSFLNKLIFVPVESFTNSFSITLTDKKTQKEKILNTTSK